jgi:hypothetical protein
MSSVPRDFVFNRFEGRQGMAWLAQAYAMFSRQRLLWVVLLLAYYALLLLLRSVPYIGPYAMTVLKPVFAVGLLAAAWTQERGGRPALSQLFVGFRANIWSLLPIGVFYVAGITAAVFASSLVDGGKLLDLMSNAGTMSEEQITAALAEGTLEAGMLFSAVMAVPVLLATWWAPALVVFQNAGAGAALVTSLRAAMANWKPLLVYALGVFFYGAVLPTIAMGVVTLALPEAVAGPLGLGLLLPYGIVVAATLQISDYISYRDVFHAGETLAPLPAAEAGGS